MRVEVMYFDLAPYPISPSRSPLIIGGWAGACCPRAGAAALKVRPPAKAVPFLRNSLRAGRFSRIDALLAN
jgi:hypothetical protein